MGKKKLGIEEDQESEREREREMKGIEGYGSGKGKGSNNRYSLKPSLLTIDKRMSTNAM